MAAGSKDLVMTQPVNENGSFTHFMPLISFYTSRKSIKKKTCFLKFSEDIEWNHPANIYLFKVNNGNTRSDIAWVKAAALKNSEIKLRETFMILSS